MLNTMICSYRDLSMFEAEYLIHEPPRKKVLTFAVVSIWTRIVSSTRFYNRFYYNIMFKFLDKQKKNIFYIRTTFVYNQANSSIFNTTPKMLRKILFV